MSLRCLLGHEMGPPVIEESEESEMTVRKQTRTCLRCGKKTVEYENTRVSINEIENSPDPHPESPVDTPVENIQPHTSEQASPDPNPVGEDDIKTPEAPDYTTVDLPEDETYHGQGDALIIDDSSEPDESVDAPPSPSPTIGVMENAYGEMYAPEEEPEDASDFNHNAFKGDVEETPVVSSDPGEILTDDEPTETSSTEEASREYDKNHVFDQSIVLTCNNCSFTEPQAGSALRAGDICGSCGSGYLNQCEK